MAINKQGANLLVQCYSNAALKVNTTITNDLCSLLLGQIRHNITVFLVDVLLKPWFSSSHRKDRDWKRGLKAQIA